jgi:hypothetical protein
MSSMYWVSAFSRNSHSVKKCMVYDALSSEQQDLAHYYQWLHSQKEEYVKHNHYNEKK